VRLGHRLRDAILAGRDSAPPDEASQIVRQAGGDYSGDTIYRIDERGEAALLEFCASWAAESGYPFALVAEGLPRDGRRMFPAGARPADAVFECIVDPVDGTRGLMYDKRSAWALAGVAPGQAVLGRRTTLQDIAVAVQAELPTRRARLADTMWAAAGTGAAGVTLDLVTGATVPARLAPSRAGTLAHGFATIAKFFPGTKEAASRLEERLFAEVVGEDAAGAPLVFDDEYISSGGQLYELMVGHDRFIADLRPALMAAAARPGDCARLGERGATAVREDPGRRAAGGLCARPYDLCTELIAREAGVIVTDEWGAPLAAPLDTETGVAWTGYANAALRDRIQPVLQRLLAELGAPPPQRR
jgi:hypothetical protein